MVKLPEYYVLNVYHFVLQAKVTVNYTYRVSPFRSNFSKFDLDFLFFSTVCHLLGRLLFHNLPVGPFN